VSALNLKDIPENKIFELVEKMDVRGPRYTSYPTVPVWKNGSYLKPFNDSLNRISHEAKPVAVYIHLPFCKTRCFYCGCNSCINRDENKFRLYIDALKKEIDIVHSHLTNGLTHCQLHLGGGTPTHTPPDMLAEVLDYLIERIPGTENCERSIEVDPRVTSDDHLKLLADRGFNRISAGLQDLNPAVQKAVNRVFSADDMKRFVDKVREHGFTSVNIDLIYGLPHQTRETWANTLKEVLNFSPDRLACFGYAHLPAKIKHQRAIKETDLPAPRARLGMLLDSFRFFTDTGYDAIGMDHFAKSDDELAIASREGYLWRNFMGYTPNHGLELLGLGGSSISEFNDLFVQNIFPPEAYQDEINSGKMPITKGCQLDRDDVIRKNFINHLMCNLEVKIPSAETDRDNVTIEKLNDAMSNLSIYENEGLIVPENGGYKITSLGQLFLRNIAMPFDRYLPEDSTTKFSRTV
jgi:oxygen-independent coproporphyrinogen-3 oxidase